MWIKRFAVLPLLATLAACFDSASAITFPLGATSLGTGATGVNAGIAGAWSRTIVFIDDAGFAQSSQTLWRFNADGSGSLTVIATNLTAGLSDTTVTAISWSIVNTTLQITLLAPGSGSLALDFTLAGDRLTLGGQSFLRRS